MFQDKHQVNSNFQTNKKVRNNYNPSNRRNQHQEPLLSSISHQGNGVNMTSYKQNGDLIKKSPCTDSKKGDIEYLARLDNICFFSQFFPPREMGEVWVKRFQ